MTVENTKQISRGLGGILDSDFLKAASNLRSENKKSGQSNQLAAEVQDIFLDRSTSKRTKSSVRALQDAALLASVIDRLQNISSCSCSHLADKKSFSKTHGTRPRITKKSRPKVHTRRTHHTKANKTTLKSSKKPIKDEELTKSFSRLFNQNEVSSSRPKTPPNAVFEKEIKNEPIAKENSLLLSNDLSLSEQSLNSNIRTPSPLLTETHVLEPSYANRLRRRQAMARRKPKKSNVASIRLKDSPYKESPSKATPFKETLPLDKKCSPNFIKKCLNFLSNSPKEPETKSDPKKDKRRNYIQRSHLPIHLIENIPASEQIRCYVNVNEVEAYKKSGMNYLNLDKLDQKAYKESVRAKNLRQANDSFQNLGSSETFHDIWYEDLSPPLDSVSVYVYWWGYEVYIPKKILENLHKQSSVTSSTLNFISILLSSVPLIQPFIKILTAFISMESSASNLFQSPQGTVLSAIWILPFLIIPRSWY